MEEEPRGEGMQQALGDLLTCPYCIGVWIVTPMWFGMVLAPRLTRFVAGILATDDRGGLHAPTSTCRPRPGASSSGGDSCKGRKGREGGKDFEGKPAFFLFFLFLRVLCERLIPPQPATDRLDFFLASRRFPGPQEIHGRTDAHAAAGSVGLGTHPRRPRLPRRRLSVKSGWRAKSPTTASNPPGTSISRSRMIAASSRACSSATPPPRTVRPCALADGMQVQVHGDLTVYESRGQYQLVVGLVQAQGIGRTPGAVRGAQT